MGIHLLPVAHAGLVGLAFTNSPAAIPARGGRKALTTVVRGRIMMAMRKGERIPEGWALDRHGKPTTDPKEAIEHGSLFPIGGAKGAMLALTFELPGERRFAAEKAARKSGIEVPDDLLAQIEKLAQ